MEKDAPFIDATWSDPYTLIPFLEIPPEPCWLPRGPSWHTGSVHTLPYTGSFLTWRRTLKRIPAPFSLQTQTWRLLSG